MNVSYCFLVVSIAAVAFSDLSAVDHDRFVFSLQDHDRRFERYLRIKDGEMVAGRYVGDLAIAQSRVNAMIVASYDRKQIEISRSLIQAVLSSGDEAAVKNLAYQLSLQTIRDHRIVYGTVKADVGDEVSDHELRQVLLYVEEFLGKHERGD